ncbi:LPS-assembly protein LptD [Roseomonas sp. CCTCC AB2023176]|uniref:LPS-assembly protein LptD n=1 Tax=Roseomonas sp. CCTCC AB2023176 TaxID=3342640 RepID=UPI0035D8C697
MTEVGARGERVTGVRVTDAGRRVPRRGRPGPRAPLPDALARPVAPGRSRRRMLSAGVAFAALLLATPPSDRIGRALAQMGSDLPAGVVPGAPVASQPGPAAATAPARAGSIGPNPVTFDRNTPVTFTAEDVTYDQGANRVTASGRVEAWQNDRLLRADRFTYDRNTGVAVAEGNVQLLEPDGQVLFADRVELQGGMRDAAVDGIRALLAQNGRLVANGGNRVVTPGGAAILDLARPVYTACNLCAENPAEPPLWQLRSRLATQDGEQRRIRFRDAAIDFDGLPLFYTPYLSVPDPSNPRSSGFLSPSFGQTRFLGAFVETPYFWAIDDSTDLTIKPIIASELPPGLNLAYRQRFNFGEISARGTIGSLTRDQTDGSTGLGGSIFARGNFVLDENWRAGFSLNRATSVDFLRVWREPVSLALSSRAFAEGFWGSRTYALAEGLAFQGLRQQDDVALIPYVAPNLYFDHRFARDSFGGWLGLDATAFNLYRTGGTSTRRAGTRLSYELPRFDGLGGAWTFRAQADGLAYNADRVDEAPFFGPKANINEATGNIRVALDWRMPFVRQVTEFGGLGQILIEPRVQVVTGPSMGRQTRIPNEDSVDLEFTDANLFDLNRFPGRDRQEGGTRVDAALRSAWFFPNGGMVEGLVGRSYRFSKEEVFDVRSGLEERASDWVARARVQPTPWLGVTGRTRLEGETLDRRLVDVSGTLGLGPVGLEGTSVTAGYLYRIPLDYQTPRRFTREIYGGVSTRLSPQWRASAFGRYDLEERVGVAVGAGVTYEDECFVFDTRFYHSYANSTTRNTAYGGGTTLLFRVSLKTVGDFGFRAL